MELAGGGPLGGEEDLYAGTREDALWVGRRSCMQGGGPLYGEEALCAEKRPSVWKGDHLCCEDAPLRSGGLLCVERRPHVQGGGPLCGDWRGGPLCRRPSRWGGDPVCRKEALCVGMRPSVSGRDSLCRGEALCVEGASPCCEEASARRMPSVQGALCVQRRPSVRRLERRPSVWIGGPLCGEEALCVGMRFSLRGRPSVCGGGPLAGVEAF